MPLYEWECLACDIRFEELAPVSEGQLERACPGCGRMSPRVVSTFAIASGASPQPQTSAPAKPSKAPEAPICLRYPHIPLLCHMDKPTAERAVAYAQGRGAEYDDRKGQAEETRKKRGLPPPPPPAPAPHAHYHKRHQAGGTQEHGHSGAGHDHGAKSTKPASKKTGQASPAPANSH
jgi:putative FmdB family regulatory protein